MKDTLHLSAPKPRMIAHRGVSGLEKENTCSAFVAAGNRSYFGIETDVHLTADGKFIIIHDDDTLRVSGELYAVEETDFETLRQICLLDTDGRRGRADLLLPELSEYIGICKKYDKVSVLELKNHMPPEAVRQIAETIRKEGWLEQTIFISFDLPNLLALREALPEQPAQYLVSKIDGALLDTLKAHRLDLDIWYKALTPEFAAACRANQIKVNVWTVDTLEDCRRMTAWGVDYITSNIVE